MKCPNCGKSLEKNYPFCPFCGSRMRRKSLFEHVFSRFGGEMDITKQVREMQKEMVKQFEALDISPFFKTPATRKGFTIKIVRRGGTKPQITVKTFGNVDKETIKRKLSGQLGIPAEKLVLKRAQPPVPVPSPVPKPPVRPKRPATPRRPELPAPKVTEEPKTEVRRVDSKVIVDMDIPGVKSEKDIRIQELQESVEVKAIAGDKAFFKIITKPAQFRLSKKNFNGGKLHLEFA